MGKGNFGLPQHRHPSTDHQKICHRWLRRQPLQLCEIRCISVHGGLLGAWVKYNQNYFYLYLFWGTHLQVRRVDGFSSMMAQTTRIRARIYHFGDFFTLLPINGVKNPDFGAWICVSSQTREIENRAYHQNYCIESNQILHSDKDHQMPFVGGPHTRITNPRWRTAATLEKSINC